METGGRWLEGGWDPDFRVKRKYENKLKMTINSPNLDANSNNPPNPPTPPAPDTRPGRLTEPPGVLDRPVRGVAEAVHLHHRAQAVLALGHERREHRREQELEEPREK